MKAKRLAPLALLLPLTLLAACGGTVQVVLTPNWYYDPVNFNIDDDREELLYEVKYTSSEQSAIDLKYETGTYQTVLLERASVADKADWAKGTGYTLSTELKISGSYLNSGKTEAFEDIITSEVTFLSTEGRLRPISSVKMYDVHTFYAAVSHYHYSYTATYDEELSEAQIEIKNLGGDEIKERSETVDVDGGLYWDNEQLLFCLRTLDLSTSAATISTINPVTLECVDVAMTSSPAEGKYRETTFTIGGVEKAKQMPAVFSFDIGYTSDRSGRTQHLVYAKPAEKDFRCALIEMTTTAPDGMGTFTYTLKSLSTF